VLGRGAEAKDEEPKVPIHLETALVESEAGNFPGLFGNFSKNPTKPLKGTMILSGTVNETGCTAYKLPSGIGPQIVLVRRGICSFEKKALLAQDAGASGLVIVNADDYPIMMKGDEPGQHEAVYIFVASLGKTAGSHLLENLLKHGGVNRGVVTVSVYHPNLWNLSEVFIVAMATSLIVAGAFFSTADMRKGSVIAQHSDEVVEMSTTEALSLVVLMSIVLVFLFFFMKYAIYVIICGFCLGGGSTLAQFGSMFFMTQFPAMKTKACTIPLFGSVTQAEVAAAAPAFLMVASWAYLRNTSYGWPFQDVIGAAFLCLFQRTIRLPDIQVGAVLLSCMFFFDIFWVFLSPYLFHESVMVAVAKGGGTGESVPMLLVLPTIGDPIPGIRMLGFGDIAIPGLLISYLLRYDKLSKRGDNLCKGYFLPAVIGYAFGLSITIAALCIMGIGQPALLYLVPCTLGTTLLLSCCRGEFRQLWNGRPVNQGAQQQDDIERNPPGNQALNAGGDGAE